MPPARGTPRRSRTTTPSCWWIGSAASCADRSCRPSSPGTATSPTTTPSSLVRVARSRGAASSPPPPANSLGDLRIPSRHPPPGWGVVKKGPALIYSIYFEKVNRGGVSFYPPCSLFGPTSPPPRWGREGEGGEGGGQPPAAPPDGWVDKADSHTLLLCMGDQNQRAVGEGTRGRQKAFGLPPASCWATHPPPRPEGEGCGPRFYERPCPQPQHGGQVVPPRARVRLDTFPLPPRPLPQCFGTVREVGDTGTVINITELPVEKWTEVCGAQGAVRVLLLSISQHPQFFVVHQFPIWCTA